MRKYTVEAISGPLSNEEIEDTIYRLTGLNLFKYQHVHETQVCLGFESSSFSATGDLSAVRFFFEVRQTPDAVSSLEKHFDLTVVMKEIPLGEGNAKPLLRRVKASLLGTARITIEEAESKWLLTFSQPNLHSGLYNPRESHSSSKNTSIILVVPKPLEK